MRRSVLLVVLLLAVLLVPATGQAAKRGIDVSRFQGDINWQRVGKTKVKFAFIQATRGSGRDCLVAPEHCGPDPYYLSNMEGARAQGIKVGAYHRAFASGRTRKAAKRDAIKEARVFARTVGKVKRRDLLPVLDIETPFTALSDKRLRLWINVWLKRVERRLNARPMIYTNHSSWQATNDTRRFARHGYRLWVANFNVKSPLVPARNWANYGYSVWQFTSTGSVKGIRGHVDKNRLGVPLRHLEARRSKDPIPLPKKKR